MGAPAPAEYEEVSEVYLDVAVAGVLAVLVDVGLP